MNKFIITITIIFSVFGANHLLSSSLLKRVENGSRELPRKKSSLIKKTNDDPGDSKISQIPKGTSSKYSLEETARILRSKGIAYFQLDHDDHVYKCIKISNNAKNLEGAVDAIIAYKTQFGDTIDDDEVNLIIRISRVNTDAYEEVARLARKIGKTKTTVKEHFNIVGEAEKGNAVHLVNGIERSRACSYKMANDYFSKQRLTLFVNIGKLKDEERFFDIYSAMRRVGMGKNINSTTLEILYKMYLLKGAVAEKVKYFLQENNWKSRKLLGDREYFVVRDMMRANEKHYPMLDGFKKTERTKTVKKKRPKKKYVRKKKKIKRKKIVKKKKKKSFFDDPCSQILKK